MKLATEEISDGEFIKSAIRGGSPLRKLFQSANILLKMIMSEPNEVLNKFPARWHDKLIELFQPLPRGKILDIPCETGKLARKLQALGFQVVCSDINPAHFQERHIPFQQADLNQSLPFENASYDYIVSAEGIEHIENPYQMIREFVRILKPAGILMLTTPNILSLKARLKFLFRSAFTMFRDYTDNANQNYLKITGHINPVSFSELKYILQRSGFKIEGIHTNRYVGEKNIFYRLLAQQIRSRTIKKNPDASFLLKKELLYGEHLIITAQRNV